MQSHVASPLYAHPLNHAFTHPPRSDSNGEDLEGYAGAGLYESITMDPTSLVRVDYNEDPITSDPGFRQKVGRSLGVLREEGGGEERMWPARVPGL